MSHRTFTAEIDDWLISKALADPDTLLLFEKLCERLHGIGLPLDRAALSWPTLHPLFRAERVYWHRGGNAMLEQYRHDSERTDVWLKSPFYHVQTNGLSYMRRNLTGPNRLLDFPVLEEFAEEGFTDYLLTRTNFRIAEVSEFAGRETGMMASWATKRPGGFSDDDLDALKHIQKLLAVACHASIQKRVMANLANAYLGPTAGWQVLTGDIRRGDGDQIPAVVWYSDLRGSTRLSDTMDPDSYLALLNRYFECTATPIIDHGGEILNFIGDGVLAIFPIAADCPRDASQQAERAVRAALEAAALAERDGTPGGAPLRFGVGLAIGSVMFGNIGVPSRLAFSGIGKVVNAVQRIESCTKTLGIPVLASPDFAEAAPGDWVPAAEIDIPDFDKRFQAYTLPELLPATDPSPTISQLVAR